MSLRSSRSETTSSQSGPDYSRMSNPSNTRSNSAQVGRSVESRNPMRPQKIDLDDIERNSIADLLRDRRENLQSVTVYWPDAYAVVDSAMSIGDKELIRNHLLPGTFQ